VKSNYDFVIKRFNEKYSKIIHRKSIKYNVDKFKNHGSVENRYFVERKKTVLTPTNIENVKTNIKQFKSVRKLSNKTAIPKTSVHRILRKELKLFPYKVQLEQHLTKNAEILRKKFCEIMLEKIKIDPEFINNIWFTDESHFHLTGFVNKQTMRIWGTERPDEVIQKKAHSLYVTVWCAISARGIIGPYFFENSDGVRETVKQSNYQHMIENYFVPKLVPELVGNDFKNQVFMQDGASPHTAKATLELLKKHFGARIIIYKCENFWPPLSPDINPCDFYLWGYTKDKVFYEIPTNLNDLKSKIIKVISEIPKETLQKVIKNLIFRFNCCVNKNGKHFSNILK